MQLNKQSGNQKEVLLQSLNDAAHRCCSPVGAVHTPLLLSDWCCTQEKEVDSRAPTEFQGKRSARNDSVKQSESQELGGELQGAGEAAGDEETAGSCALLARTVLLAHTVVMAHCWCAVGSYSAVLLAHTVLLAHCWCAVASLMVCNWLIQW